jgi:hypothetical protein
MGLSAGLQEKRDLSHSFEMTCAGGRREERGERRKDGHNILCPYKGKEWERDDGRERRYEQAVPRGARDDKARD